MSDATFVVSSVGVSGDDTGHADVYTSEASDWGFVEQ
jgi:hypothetical protein